MAIFETFSKRLKRQQGPSSDVYQYDDIPLKLRVQAAELIARCFGVDSVEMYFAQANPAWVKFHEVIAPEFGFFQLPNFVRSHRKAVIEFMANDATTSEFLDMVDLAVKLSLKFHSDPNWVGRFDEALPPEDLIMDLNERFRQNAIGYQVAPNSLDLIRVDSEHLHNEAVLPVLELLASPKFEGANAEYRQAHRHYMSGDYKECLNECLKAFESTLKSICTLKSWTYASGDTASRLIDICINNGLFPGSMNQHLGSIKALLTSAIPTLRNKHSGHGQGVSVTEVPRYFAQYLLHETATSIIFIFSAYSASSKKSNRSDR